MNRLFIAFCLYLHLQIENAKLLYMKRKLLLFNLVSIYLSLFCLPAAADGVEIYGFSTNIDDETQSGLIKFNSDNPANTMQRIKIMEEWATAGAWGGDAYYAILSYATYPKGLYTIDVQTGETNRVADYMYREDVRAAIEMSYDFTTETMYMVTVSDEDEYATAFGTINLRTGEQRFINTNMGCYVVAMAINKSGRVYGITDNGTVMSINKTTGKCTNLFNLETYPWRKQSMEFDRENGDLYWAYCDTDDFGYLKKIKINTRKVTDIGYIGGESKEQVLGLYIPYKQCEDDAPHKVTDLQLTPDKSGELTATFSWTCPTTTYVGETLSEIEKIEIYRDESLVATLTEGVAPGTSVVWNDRVTTSGEYVYKIVPCNTAGSGLPATISAFIGRDVPKATTFASVTRVGNNAVRLAWHPVTTGANKGYLDLSSIVYKVTRTSDGTVLAENLTDTIFTDSNITALDRYQYEVLPSNADGVGEATATGYIVNGPARQLPLATDFTDEAESQLWSIADADGDGQTYFWQYNPNFKDQGFFYYQCKYAPTGHADDWVVSPKYTFDAGVAYKVLITARPCNIYRPEKMMLYLIKDYDLDKAISLSDTIHVSGEEDATGETVLSQFRVNIAPLVEAGEYSLGIRCVSDFTEAYWLALAKVEVSANQEGHIRGDVYDNEGNPVEGVVVSLEGTDFSATTDARGQFEIMNVPEGTYTTVQTKLGYTSVSKNVTVEGLQTVNVELDVNIIGTLAMKGEVRNEYGEPLAGATVSLTGYNCYQVQTDATGAYLVEGIYLVEESYNVRVSKDFYSSATAQAEMVTVNGIVYQQDFTLNDSILPPALVKGEIITAEGNVEIPEISWTQPGVEKLTEAFSNQGSYTFGTDEGDHTTLIGLVCRESMVLKEIDWSVFIGDSTINVTILALDAAGNATDEVLYQDLDAPNKGYNLTTYALKESVYAPNGCFIGLSCDEGNLYLLTTTPTAEKPFVKNFNAYIEDYTKNTKLEYVESLGKDYEENFFISYTALKLAVADAPTVKYMMVPPANVGEELEMIEVDGLSYTDLYWKNLNEGEYSYVVEAVYRNGKSAGQTINFTKITPSGIEEGRSDTEASVWLQGNVLIIRAEAVQVVNVCGQVVVAGEAVSCLSTENWEKGLYLVRTLEGGKWKSSKMYIR